MVAKLTADELLNQINLLSNLEEQIIYLCQKFDAAQTVFNAANPQFKKRALELFPDFLSKTVVVQFSFPLDGGSTLSPATVAEAFPTSAANPDPDPEPEPEPEPTPPRQATTDLLPYYASPAEDGYVYDQENGEWLINDGDSNTVLLKVSGGTNGLLSLTCSFENFVVINSISVVNPANNFPTRLRIFAGTRAFGDSPPLVYTATLAAGNNTFNTFATASFATTSQRQFFTCDFDNSGGAAVAVRELSFGGYYG